MEKYVEGSVSAIVTGSGTSTPIKKKLGKRKKLNSTSDSQQKNVRFDCSPSEKDHFKYNVTPFSSCVKKRGKGKECKERIINKTKLSFDEGISSLKKKKSAKKQKLEEDQSTKKSLGNQIGIATVEKQIPGNETLGSDETAQISNGLESSHNLSAIDGGNKNISRNKERCTIFVGNLPLTYDHKKVVKLFSKFGPVENARVRCVPVPGVKIPKKTTAITKKFNPNRSSAVAYVVFKSEESVHKAVAENGMVINDHHLRIDYEVTSKKDSKKSVFVGGLPFDVEDDELWNAFKDCGEIEDVRIIRDNATGMGKGFGFVNFKSSASVELALQLNDHEIKNRKINVQRCTYKRKKSYQKFISPKNVNMKKKRDKNQAGKGSSKSEKGFSHNDFQGRIAEQRKKKKKNKPTKDTLRRNKIKSVFGLRAEKLKKDKPQPSN